MIFFNIEQKTKQTNMAKTTNHENTGEVIGRQEFAKG